ncbi:MAG: type I methionyl aminopeptidase [Omnitrophica WOR_2 bacterium RBG_13_41_10]|nr:MAG: type I methionyl aminopeptidase [Omnitrophica WOR_2 bacterium RBG_13_41_10]
MIPIKSKEELDILRRAGKILGIIIKELFEFTKAGVSTEEIDRLAESLFKKNKVEPAFKGYKGFPASICTSTNAEIVHGIPGSRELKEGDIIGLDVGVIYNGYFSDAAVTKGIGKISPQAQKLLEVTKSSLSEGIKQAKAGNHLYDISSAIQGMVEKNGFSIVREFVGHGIGAKLHEEPEIPNFGNSGQGPVLASGMVLAIEPMVNVGTWKSRILDNNWTAVTKDGLLSAHFEHTVAITENGPEILTNI